MIITHLLKKEAAPRKDFLLAKLFSQKRLSAKGRLLVFSTSANLFEFLQARPVQEQANLTVKISAIQI